MVFKQYSIISHNSTEKTSLPQKYSQYVEKQYTYGPKGEKGLIESIISGQYIKSYHRNIVNIFLNWDLIIFGITDSWGICDDTFHIQLK